MQEVIYLDKIKSEKPVEFTHFMDSDEGWILNKHDLNDIGEISYLGNDLIDGDLFMAKENGYLRIYKGHLNSGKY